MSTSVQQLYNEGIETSGSESEDDVSSASSAAHENSPIQHDKSPSHIEQRTNNNLGSNSSTTQNAPASNYVWGEDELAMDLAESSSPPSSEMEPVLGKADTEGDNEASPSSPMSMDPSTPSPQSSPIPQSSSSPQSSGSSNVPMEEDLPGAPLRSFMPALERLHQRKIALGEDPAMPFADYLEFEFVKWMVEHDISQRSREKLINLPIVCP